MKFLLNSIEVDKDTFLSKVHDVALQHELYHVFMAIRFGISITSFSATVKDDFLSVICTTKMPKSRGLRLMISWAPYFPQNLLDMLLKIAKSKDPIYRRLQAIRRVLEYGLYEILDFLFKLHQKRIFLWVK